MIYIIGMVWVLTIQKQDYFELISDIRFVPLFPFHSSQTANISSPQPIIINIDRS